MGAPTMDWRKPFSIAGAMAVVASMGYFAFADTNNPETAMMRARCFAFLEKGRGWDSIPGEEQIRIVEVCNNNPHGLLLSRPSTPI